MNWKIWSYQLPLRYPLMVLGDKQKTRKGFIIGQRQNGQWTYGEAAPLPSFHKVSHKQVFEQLQQYFKGNDLSSSSVAQFAIDMLYFTAHSSYSIAVNSLSTGNIVEDRKLSDTCQYIKVKVGRKSIQEDRDHLRNLRDHFSKELRFRVDANRLWDRDQAQHFIDTTQDLNIEYIEEPTKEPQDIRSLQGANIALDESLEDHPEAQLYPQVTHIIIKPTLQGGISGTNSWAEKAKEHRQKIILSSTFESSLGLWMLGQLAGQLAPNNAHGLDTLRWFSCDLSSDHLRKNRDHIIIPKDPPKINFSQLQLEAEG